MYKTENLDYFTGHLDVVEVGKTIFDGILYKKEEIFIPRIEKFIGTFIRFLPT
jgi:hypothetical protein